LIGAPIIDLIAHTLQANFLLAVVINQCYTTFFEDACVLAGVQSMEAIYRSDGEWVAVYEKGNLFNVDREWIGFTVGREVFDTSGEYLGFLSDDRRLLRKRTLGKELPQYDPPPRPSRPEIPASVPLAPMLAELPYPIIDLFVEYPERLIYISETRPDMD
jgi:hypothetical protein